MFCARRFCMRQKRRGFFLDPIAYFGEGNCHLLLCLESDVSLDCQLVKGGCNGCLEQRGAL